MKTRVDKQTLLKVLFIVCIVLCGSTLISSPVALVGGFLFTWIFGNPFHHLTGKVTKWLLKIAVVGLGFGLNVNTALTAGKEGFFLTLFSISTVLVLGYILGKVLKIIPRTSHLIASGTAICGGSAIAAVAPVIKASDNDISVSLGIIFFLNSVALLIFPPIGHLLDMSQHQFGLWSAIAIHDTSSVVGAAAVYGEEALNVAVTVKLARTLWIIPIAILSAFMFKNKSSKISIPWFIGLFILAMLANTYIPFVANFSGYVLPVSKSLLVITLFLIGAGLSIEKIKAVGAKPLILGLLLWIFISISSLFFIL